MDTKPPGLSLQCTHRYASGFMVNAAFETPRGVSALFGPSGSGKTTILALIAGMLRPDRGSITLAGRSLVDVSRGVDLKPEHRGVGMVFQDDLLFPHITVRENLCYGQRRKPRRAIALPEVVDVLELGSLLDRYPRQLSGGQRRRIALGRAILRGPDLLLLDEPLTGLDRPLKERVLKYLASAIRRWEIASLLVTHDQAEVRRLAEYVVVISAGRVTHSGRPEAVLDRAILDAYPQTHQSPLNLLRIDEPREVAGHMQGSIGSQTFHLPPQAPQGPGPVFVRFAPSDVTLARGDVAGLSVRNQLVGTVLQIVPTGVRVFIAIDVGQPLWAEVTPDAVAELGLAEGMTVRCLIKASAAQVAC